MGRPGRPRWHARQGARLGRWTLVGRKELGRGGNGTVWEAQADGEDARYAIKILGTGQPLTQERRGRFADEVAFLSGEPGAGVLPLIDSHLAADRDDISWYVMPLATPLLNELGSQASIETILDVVATIAETLARLAAQGIGHRDIKPDNLFTLDSKPVLGDFGLVTFPGKDNRTTALKKLGPANYHAPEMLTNPDTAAFEPADVWSLAKTLWVLLTGQNYPQPGEYRPGDPYSLRSWMTDPYAWIAELDDLIMQCTRLRPESRPSMAQFARELRACLAEPPEVHTDTDEEALRARLVALTSPARDEQREAQLVRQRFDKARGDLDLLHSSVYGHLHAMLAGTFREHPGQQEPGDAFNLLRRTPMPYWHHSRGALFTSPDPASRAWVRFSVYARTDHGSEQLDLAACIQVVHCHRGLEYIPFEWKDTYSAPLGSVQFTRALATIEAAVQNTQAQCLRAIDAILNLPEDHIPDWDTRVAQHD